MMQAYASKLSGALNERNKRKSGSTLASLLKLDLKSSSNVPSSQQVTNAIRSNQFAEIVTLHFEAQRQASRKNFETTMKHRKS